jgi:HrpA-like RNA helicase
MTPYDLANEFARPEVADLLLSYSQVFSSEVGNNIIQEPSRMNNYNSTDDVLKSFYAKYSQDHANLDLIVEVLNYVQGYSQPGTILVLLPAYSEVVELRDMIIASNSSLKNKLDVHTLHGHLFPNDFKKIFFPAPADKRKVILATNIAETSISFDDVICVIDSGLFRDRENDVVFTNPKKTQWISKASAAQRVMHVRNGGIVFHLYPRSTLDGLQEYPVPEITRDSLIDVCLYARLIIPEDMRLPQFFCSLPDGPPTTAVHQAIEILESIDAFDSQSKVIRNCSFIISFSKS